MAALTAILALAGVYVPVLGAIIMLMWTLPVVVVCMRHGMRVGLATIAVAGVAILVITSPAIAFNMLLTSAAPALLIGRGFQRLWRTEKTVLYAAAAACVGLAANVAVSVFVMGLDFSTLFSVSPETLSEMAAVFTEYGMASSLGMSAEEFIDTMVAMMSMLQLVLPAMLLIGGMFMAFTNYMVANTVLRRLKLPIPPLTRLSTFRLPLACVFGFIVGFALDVLGNILWPQRHVLVTIGQNIWLVFLAVYIFQGLGLILYYIGKAPPSMQGFWKFMLIFLIVITAFNFVPIMGYIGIADALLDFRRLETVRKDDQGDKGDKDGKVSD